MKLNDRGFIGLFVLAQALWAGSYIVGHFIVQDFKFSVTVQLCCTIAMLTLMPILLLVFRGRRSDFRDRSWWLHVLLATALIRPFTEITPLVQATAYAGLYVR